MYVSLIAAPVYDQDTTQVAEYDGGTYITQVLGASNQSIRALILIVSRFNREAARVML